MQLIEEANSSHVPGLSSSGSIIGARVAQSFGFNSPSTGKANGASLLSASHSLAMSLPLVCSLRSPSRFPRRHGLGGRLSARGSWESTQALPDAIPRTAIPRQGLHTTRLGSFTRMANYAGLLLTNRYAMLTGRMVLACIFLLSSCGKLVDITQYSIKPVVEFGILPSSVAVVFGSVLPFVELLCALGLLFGVWTRLASLGIAAMSLAFFSAKTFLLLQGFDLSCGCFGAIVTTFMSFTVYLDPPIFLLAMAVMMSSSSARRWISLRNLWQRSSNFLRPDSAIEKGPSGRGSTNHLARVTALLTQNG
jgi:uncharacterized membrane protein YphA (DoxX/SURF4 family)